MSTDPSDARAVASRAPRSADDDRSQAPAPTAAPTSAPAPPIPVVRPRPTRAELDRIFGADPVSTRDDLPEPEIPTGRDPAESWYLDNRPPHHGG